MAAHATAYRRFLARLRQARREAGLTQMQVARRLGKRQSFVSKWRVGGAAGGCRRAGHPCQTVRKARHLVSQVTLGCPRRSRLAPDLAVRSPVAPLRVRGYVTVEPCGEGDVSAAWCGSPFR